MVAIFKLLITVTVANKQLIGKTCTPISQVVIFLNYWLIGGILKLTYSSCVFPSLQEIHLRTFGGISSEKFFTSSISRGITDICIGAYTFHSGFELGKHINAVIYCSALTQQNLKSGNIKASVIYSQRSLVFDEATRIVINRTKKENQIK